MRLSKFGSLETESAAFRLSGLRTLFLRKLPLDEKEFVKKRAIEEISARLAALADAPKLLVGRWNGRYDLFTYNADRSYSEWNQRRTVAKGSWSIDEDVLTVTITERMRNGKMLAVSEEIQSRIVEAAPSKILLMSKDGKNLSYLTRAK